MKKTLQEEKERFLEISKKINEDWRDIESNIEPWGGNMELMDEMLNKWETQYGSLNETPWEEIRVIKQALWMGYNFK